jgi:hypothetical protein
VQNSRNKRVMMRVRAATIVVVSSEDDGSGGISRILDSENIMTPQ